MRQLVDHSERSEVQPHESDRVWGGSVGHSCELIDKNWIEGAAWYTLAIADSMTMALYEVPRAW